MLIELHAIVKVYILIFKRRSGLEESGEVSVAQYITPTSEAGGYTASKCAAKGSWGNQSTVPASIMDP